MSSKKWRPADILRAMVLGLVLGVAVTALASAGVVAMAVYAAWVDEHRYDDQGDSDCRW